jgi:hypothetical protein
MLDGLFQVLVSLLQLRVPQIAVSQQFFKFGRFRPGLLLIGQLTEQNPEVLPGIAGSSNFEGQFCAATLKLGIAGIVPQSLSMNHEDLFARSNAAIGVALVHDPGIPTPCFPVVIL